MTKVASHRSGAPALGKLCGALLCLLLATSAASARCTFAAHGAKGDGVGDDTAAVQTAIGSGCGPIVDGEGKTYRVTSTLLISNAKNVEIRNATLIDRVPLALNRRVLMVTDSTNVAIRNVRIDRGRDPGFGINPANRLVLPNHYGSIFLRNVTDARLEDVEVHGDGPGSAIYVLRSKNVALVRPYVHDMHYPESFDAATEQLVGIFVVASSGVAIDQPRIANLGRTGGDPRWIQSDGIISAANVGITVSNADIANVNEGFDWGGSLQTKNGLIRNSVVRDATNVCYKVTGSGGYITIQDSTAVRCGLAGFGINGPSAADIADPAMTITLLRNTAVDIGSRHFVKRGFPYHTAGFWVYSNPERPDYPRNIRLQNVSCRDTRAVRLMKFCMFSPVNPAISNNTAQDSDSVGHLESANLGFASRSP